MENNLPVISKKVWSIARILFFMHPKGFTKPKLFMRLNLMLKLPVKLAGKAFANLIHHHHHHRHNHHASAAMATTSHDNTPLQFFTPREYEFSCNNTPNNNKRHLPRHFLACTHAPPTLDDDTAAEVNDALNMAAELEMMRDDKKGKGVMVEAYSPVIYGSVRNRTVRQVRVTDSPFPVHGGGGDHLVDVAAEEYIKGFYKELRKQG